MFSQSRLTFINVVFAFSLAACGGGGGGGGGSVTGPSYSGTTAAVVMDVSNAEAVETTASIAAGDIINSQGASAPFGVEINPQRVPDSQITNLTAEIVHSAIAQSPAATMLVGATITSDQLNAEVGASTFCGGSITYPDNVNTGGSTLDITMTFNNLCFVGDGSFPQVTMNGTVRLIETQTEFTVIFSNLTMSISGGETFTLNATSTCDFVGNCTVDFVGTDGNTYRVGSLSVFGDNTSGYNYSATFYHPDYGSVSVTTTTPLTFNCTSAARPDAGELAFVGDGGTSGRIVFTGCSTYTFCVNDGMGEVCDTTGTW